METKATETTDKAILVKIADKLMEAQREIDELVLQLALGKAEARDKFEETKKEFRTRVAEFKATSLGAHAAEASKKLKDLLEELEAELNLGKVDSRERLEEQKKKIEAVVAKVRAEFKRVKGEMFDKEQFENEFEKFKLKVEVLRLRFELKKFEVRDSFKEGMHEAKMKIEQMAEKLNEKLSSTSKLSSLRKEVKDMYKHLHKAVESI